MSERMNCPQSSSRTVAKTDRRHCPGLFVKLCVTYCSENIITAFYLKCAELINGTLMQKD